MSQPNDRDAQVRFHQEAAAERHANRVGNPFIRCKEVALAKAIAPYVGHETARVLEVGCGEGSNLWFVANARPTWRLFGVDISTDKVAFARRMQPRIGTATADALALPFADRTFDAVVCRDLLHHVNWDRDGVVKEALRVVRPGGPVLVFEGRGTTLLNRIFSTVYPVERGMRDSTPASIEALLARYGTPELKFLEASSAVRAVGFVVGWPSGPMAVFARGVYQAASLWERTLSWLLPRRRWVYMLAVVCRED